jgi:hypothetical protein
VASWGLDHGDVYPDVVGRAVATTLPGGGAGPAVGVYVDNWPENAWRPGTDMTEAVTGGDYTYTPGVGRRTFTLAGHMSSGEFVVP